MPADKITNLLKEYEVKVTPARVAILNVLDEAEKHLSIDEIFERAKKEIPNLGIATTYRTVKLLNDFNLLIKHNFEDCEALYERKGSDIHSHMIDIETKIVSEFESPDLEKVIERLAREQGCKLMSYKVELYVQK